MSQNEAIISGETYEDPLEFKKGESLTSPINFIISEFYVGGAQGNNNQLLTKM